MQSIKRRSLVSLPLAALPVAASAQAAAAPPIEAPGLVPAGQDREHRQRVIGLSSTTYKVLTRDSASALFVMEQKNAAKGGPSRHLHHNEDELFYVLEGEYDVEVAGHRVSLKPGDCILGPKGLPHAWARVGTAPGRLLISFAPAGKMEAFFAAREKLVAPGHYAGETARGNALMREFGMENVGPPLTVT